MTRIVRVKPLEGYRLEVEFDDGLVKVVELEEYLFGEVFAPLKDPRVFRQVELDRVLGTVVWPTGADFCPDFLRNEAKGKIIRKPRAALSG